MLPVIWVTSSVRRSGRPDRTPRRRRARCGRGRGDDYADFADLFELAVGLLALGGGTRTRVAYVAAIGFHVALLSFGWGAAQWVPRARAA